MASAIDTETANPADLPGAFAGPTNLVFNGSHAEPGAAPAPEPTRRIINRSGGRAWRRAFSPLTLRILAVNVLALALLAAGFLYLGKYQAGLIDQQIESLKTQGKVFAAALGEGAVLELSRRGRGSVAGFSATNDAPAGRADQDPGAAIRP